MNSPALELHDVSVAYDKAPVLYGVDLAIEPGKIVGIVGPNGAGKSTLIQAIMGLQPLRSGWIKIFGQPIAQSRPHLGYVPQRTSVDWDFPVSVMDVVLMGRYGKLGLLRRPGAADRELARRCLEKVDLLPLANRQIGQLSGGQQQRVFIARAMAQQSELYLMDEPFAGVDAATEKALLGLLRTMAQQGKTLFIVHHDLPTAREYFDHLILLNMRVVASGPTEEVFTQELLQKTYGGRLTILTEVAQKSTQSP